MTAENLPWPCLPMSAAHCAKAAQDWFHGCLQHALARPQEGSRLPVPPQCRSGRIPDWVRSELDDWLAAAAIDRGKLFRRVNKVGKAWGDSMTEKVVWHILKELTKIVSVAKLASHDLSRPRARLLLPTSRSPSAAPFGSDGALPQPIAETGGLPARKMDSRINNHIQIINHLPVCFPR